MCETWDTKIICWLSPRMIDYTITRTFEIQMKFEISNSLVYTSFQIFFWLIQCDRVGKINSFKFTFSVRFAFNLFITCSSKRIILMHWILVVLLEVTNPACHCIVDWTWMKQKIINITMGVKKEIKYSLPTKI